MPLRDLMDPLAPSFSRVRGAWLCAIALAAACSEPEGKPPIYPEDTTDPADTTGVDTVDTPTTVDTTDSVAPLRPLCALEVPKPAIAADIVAYSEAMFASDDWYYGERVIRQLEAEGDPVEPDAARVDRLITRGFERLKFRDIGDAIADLTEAVTLAETTVPERRELARRHLAIAWLRKGELDNCIAGGVGESCIAPFAEEAQHRITEGMTNASAVIRQILTEDAPTSLTNRWLLNVAAMALGTYPDGLEPEWLVPPETINGVDAVPPWTNVAPALGMHDANISGGVTAEDFDGDGLTDLLVSNINSRVGMQLFLQMGDGYYCDASDASGVSAIPGVLQLTISDYDNDGDVDVLAPRGAWSEDNGEGRPSLLRNDGTGVFTDVAVEAGLTNVIGPSQTTAWADIDGDGLLDVYFGRERHHPELGRLSYPASLYHNNGDGTFTDIAEAAGVATPGFVKGAVWSDFDEDGDPDLYVSLMGDNNRLYENLGDLTFVDRAARTGVQEPRMSFSAAILDYDQDGDQDLFCAAFPTQFTHSSPLADDFGRTIDPFVADLLDMNLGTDTLRVFRNEDGGPFTDVTAQLGINDVSFTMGSSTGDLNADGFPDIYLGTGSSAYETLQPNEAYLNVGGTGFVNVTTAARLGHLQKGHGISFADLDEDGDEDIYAEMGGAFPNDNFPNALFENPTNPEHGLILRLEGVTSNRSAIGAMVRVVFPGRVGHYQVGPGSSFGGNSLQVEVAMGDETEVTRVEIDWPGGSTETITDVPLDVVAHVVQGQGIADTRPLRHMVFPHPVDDHGTAP